MTKFFIFQTLFVWKSRHIALWKVWKNEKFSHRKNQVNVFMKKLLKSWFHEIFWAYLRFTVLFHTALYLVRTVLSPNFCQKGMRDNLTNISHRKSNIAPKYNSNILIYINRWVLLGTTYIWDNFSLFYNFFLYDRMLIFDFKAKDLRYIWRR